MVELTRLGGAVASAWEGQTALLHFDPAEAPSTKTGRGLDTDPQWKEHSLSATAPPPITGVFLTRDVASQKAPGDLRAWFGLDADALAARGVQPGLGVTSHKEGLRLGSNRFVARSLDDRAGTTALLLAVKALNPDDLQTRVIFTWSVHEEGGLVGAAAMARRFGPTANRVYSIDTFVSSDTPLETPHFAYAPLGDGPVLRAIENSSISPDHERERVVRAAGRPTSPCSRGSRREAPTGRRSPTGGRPTRAVLARSIQSFSGGGPGSA